MPAFAPPRQPLPREGSNFPFLQWFGTLRAEGDARREQSRENEDFLVEDEAMKEFAIGSEGNSVFFIAGFADTMNAITSIPWSSAALIRGHQDRDWVAIACKDARIKGSKEMNPLPFRLWFPIPVVKMNVFREVKPTLLRLREISMVKNAVALKNAPPLAEVALSMKGKW